VSEKTGVPHYVLAQTLRSFLLRKKLSLTRKRGDRRSRANCHGNFSTCETGDFCGEGKKGNLRRGKAGRVLLTAFINGFYRKYRGKGRGGRGERARRLLSKLPEVMLTKEFFSEREVVKKHTRYNQHAIGLRSQVVIEREPSSYLTKGSAQVREIKVYTGNQDVKLREIYIPGERPLSGTYRIGYIKGRPI